jgi:hypothetical protein
VSDENTKPDGFLTPFDLITMEAFTFPRSKVNKAGIKVWKKGDIVAQICNQVRLRAGSSLAKLATAGFISEINDGNLDVFTTTERVDEALSQFYQSKSNLIDSQKWTGLIRPAEVAHVLSIVHQIELIAEEFSDNVAKAQIHGLVTALRALLELPESPRKPVLSLVRDEAFANLVQISALLVAIASYLKA